MSEKVDPTPASDPEDQGAINASQNGAYIKPQARKLHDTNVKFEEYYYYAQRTREEQNALEDHKTNWREFLFRKKKDPAGATHGSDAVATVKGDQFNTAQSRLEISDEEWTNASRAFRTASWGACFYLITTDILGPYSVGFALGTLGWGPGIAFYTIFGFFTAYSGYLVWRVFLGVDSHEFPARNYGDLGFRTLGQGARYATNIMQALGLLLILGQVTIQFGQNISQLSQFRICYAVCPVIFACIGFFLTQIRTLKAYGWVANLAVWLNMLVIFLSMGFISHSPPNYATAVLGSAGSAVDPDSITPDPVTGEYPPIMHYNTLPPDGLVGSLNGLLSGVLAYAGVQLFVEFMAEMRRPQDFFKAMWGAQVFIYVIYVVYGCFVYAYQGQYSYSPSYQGVSLYAWQTVGNVITLIAALIAAGLYGNIGIKVFYNNILGDILNAPPLVTTRGKIFYALIVPVWWIIAFVIAAAIPDYFGFVSVISASLLMNLTYTLPPLFALGFDIQKNLLPADAAAFDPTTGQITRTVTGVRRWAKGFFSGGSLQVALNVWHVIYILCALTMCGLGMYAAVDGMIEVFKNPVLNSFSCVSPLNLAAAG
ncbi:hypothetical protein BX600DRAFT_535999 [Xylariales sp. PMI_506]|nr:hypothetical protein BX600DRAFT_535999 [Xylariales sp. PMI_506]